MCEGGNGSELAMENLCVREGTNILDGKLVAEMVRRDAKVEAQKIMGEAID